MEEPKISSSFQDLAIGNEQVTSNECWTIQETLDESSDRADRIVQNSGMDEQQLIPSNSDQVYQDLDLGEEQVTSNECYQEEN
jgi:hypothetical protein